MSRHENSTLLIELLRSAVRFIKQSDFSQANESLRDARVVVDELNRDKSFKDSLLEDRDTARKLASELLELWHDLVYNFVNKAELDATSEAQIQGGLSVVWMLWPVMHGLLWLQTESKDYVEIAAEVYGVLSMAMESDVAVSALKLVLQDVLPLPKMDL